MLVFKVNFLKMLYKCLRIIFNNSEVFYMELKKKGKKITIQEEKLIVGTLPESPLQDL